MYILVFPTIPQNLVVYTWVLHKNMRKSLQTICYTLPDHFEKWLNTPRASFTIPTALITFFTLLYVAQNVLAYHQFRLPTYDFGIFDQVLWKIAYFQSPDISFNLQPHWLGDHFQPSLAVLAPLARLISAHWTLLIIEPILFCSGAIPLLLLGKTYTRSTIISLTVMVVYLTAVPSVAALHYTFHPSTLVPAGLLWLLWALDTRHWSLLAVLTILTLGLKEDVGYYLGFLGIWTALTYRKNPYLITGLLMATASFTWSYLATRYALPHFKQAAFETIWQLDPHLGNSMGDLARVTLLHPDQVVSVALNNESKRLVLTNILQSFGFAPLLYPVFLPIFPLLAERLLSTNPNHYSLIWHYGAPLIAVAAYMSMRGIGTARYILGKTLRKIPRITLPLPTNLLAIVISGTMVLGTAQQARSNHQNPFPRELFHTWSDSLTTHRQEALKMIPAEASIAAQDTLAANLAERNNAALLSGPLAANTTIEYVVIDPQLSFWPMPDVHMVQTTISECLSHGFSPIYSQDTILLLKKNASIGEKVELSPAITHFIQQNTP